MRPTTIYALLAAALLATSQRARAADTPADVKAADVLFQSAKAAMERGDLATACSQFAESQRLDPAPGTLLNLGECEERSGKLATALGHLETARALLPAGDFRIPFADARITGLEHRVSRLTLRLPLPQVPGLSIRLDDVDVPVADLGSERRLDPGAHVIVVRAPGHADARVEVTLREGEALQQAVAAGSAIAEAKPVASASPHGTAAVPDGSGTVGSPPTPPAAGAAQRTWGLVAGGAGVAGLAVGGVLVLVAKGTYGDALAHCPQGPASCDAQGVNGGQSAHSEANVAMVAGLGGAALLAAGLTLYLTAPREHRVMLAPAIGSNDLGVAMRGAW
jgi:hypothetical protein